MLLKPVFRGHLIAIGGNEDKANDQIVLRRVVQEVGKTDPKVAIVTTASKEPEQRGRDYQQVFTNLGVSPVEIFNIKNRIQANDEVIAKTFEGVDLIFFTGGDQLRLTTVLGGSKLLQTIKDRLEDGALIAGTSAGAAVFSDTMIYRGKSEKGLFKGSVLTTAGFSFVENIVFDTHFMTRGRIGRLIQIVTTNPSCIGIGIGEDSGVILRGDETIEVIGTGQVIIVDGAEIVHSNIMDIKRGEPIAVEHVRIHSLVDGYGYNFKERRFLRPKSDTHPENLDD